MNKMINKYLIAPTMIGIETLQQQIEDELSQINIRNSERLEGNIQSNLKREYSFSRGRKNE